MNPVFTHTSKLYTTVFSFFISILCLLGSQTTVLGLPLPTSFGANQPPVAAATSTALTGTSPLSVTFTGNTSYDPDGDPITYAWDFGDGGTSTLANPIHVFTPTLGKQGVLQVSYGVKLVVSDNKGGISNRKTFQVTVTNPAPTAKITTPVNLSKYALDKATNYTLAATVTDDTPSSLTYLWQVKLRHNGQDQVLTTASGSNPVVAISPAGWHGGEDYYYVVTVKVTDIGNLIGAGFGQDYSRLQLPQADGYGPDGYHT